MFVKIGEQSKITNFINDYRQLNFAFILDFWPISLKASSRIDPELMPSLSAVGELECLCKGFEFLALPCSNFYHHYHCHHLQGTAKFQIKFCHFGGTENGTWGTRVRILITLLYTNYHLKMHIQTTGETFRHSLLLAILPRAFALSPPCADIRCSSQSSASFSILLMTCCCSC